MKVTLGPKTIQVGDAEVHILEVIKQQRLDGTVFYNVSCYATYKNYMSPIFMLHVQNEEQLLFQLRVEVAKFKTLIMEGHDRIFITT